MLIIDNHKLESLRKYLNCPDLQVFAYAEWGSENPENRKLIHAQRDQIILSSTSPLHSSIAHTQGMGVLMISSQAVGVDVENTHRVSDPIAKRVAKPGEYEAAPSAASLWTAKEACYKALRPFKQPSVLSEFSVGDWQKITSHYETFTLQNYSEHQAPSAGAGVCFHEQKFSFGFYCVNL